MNAVLKETKGNASMNTQEAAAKLGLSREYIQRLAVSGKIKAKKIGLVWQITASELARFEASDRKRGPKVKVKHAKG